MAGQAYAVATGKAPSKRNAEVMAVEQVMRWRSEVLRYPLYVGPSASFSPYAAELTDPRGTAGG